MAFDQPYLTFSGRVAPYQRADDVGYVVTEFMWSDGKPFYPAGALADAKITQVRLKVGEFDQSDEDTLDLIFKMKGAGEGCFFEIILRSNHGTSYGGRLWGDNLCVMDNEVAGYRVLSTSQEGAPVHFVYSPKNSRYISLPSAQSIAFAPLR